jgi:hypothetical protein
MVPHILNMRVVALTFTTTFLKTEEQHALLLSNIHCRLPTPKSGLPTLSREMSQHMQQLPRIMPFESHGETTT